MVADDAEQDATGLADPMKPASAIMAGRRPARWSLVAPRPSSSRSGVIAIRSSG
jgi:hypothetical protein